ncbi:CD59B glycoprotein-like [Ptychodera flava]|uniref:CD59B glycoprotein-like n=1 Tax=Ptychodera flava TaxID=63121 RepID=UPI00396A98CC
MTERLLFVLILAIFAREAYGLRCYECSGASSNGQCNRDVDLRECSPTQDACLKAVVWSSVDGKTISKSCYWQSECDTALQTTWPCDTRQTAWACSECCDTDDCNFSDSSSASALSSFHVAMVILLLLLFKSVCE